MTGLKVPRNGRAWDSAVTLTLLPMKVPAAVPPRLMVALGASTLASTTSLVLIVMALVEFLMLNIT